MARCRLFGILGAVAFATGHSAFAQSDAPVELTVPTGRPLRVTLTADTTVSRVGQTVTGTLTEPVYAYDWIVLPAGTAVQGRITKLENPPTFTRLRSMAGGDFSPHHVVEIRFESVVRDGQSITMVVPASLVELGRLDEASTLLADLERQSGNRVPELAAAISAFMAGRHDDGVEALIAVTRTASMPDPELLFYVGRHLAHVGEPQLALPFMQRAFEAGHFCYPVLANDPWLDALRAEPAFEALLDAARMRWRHASAMFAAAGGPTLLGMSERSV